MRTCQQLELVAPGLGVVHAHALHAAVGRRGRPEEVMQRVRHLQPCADSPTAESAAAVCLESAAGILADLYLR